MIMNICTKLIPYSLITILWQTNPFWVSILGLAINGEKINKVEYFGMAICFAGVICLTLSKLEK
jgi:drug/metabolite transporter (DMT)-like permease